MATMAPATSSTRRATSSCRLEEEGGFVSAASTAAEADETDEAGEAGATLAVLEEEGEAEVAGEAAVSQSQGVVESPSQQAATGVAAVGVVAGAAAALFAPFLLLTAAIDFRGVGFAPRSSMSAAALVEQPPVGDEGSPSGSSLSPARPRGFTALAALVALANSCS